MTTPQERREQFTFDLEQESDTKLARIIFEERPGLSGIITEKMGVQFGNTSSQKVDFYATPANKEKFREVFNKLSGIVASDVHLNKKHINAIIDEVMGLSKTAGDFKTAANNSNGKVTPRNDNQKTFLSKINDNQVIFGIGPAGTGKTLMACHAAVEALKTKQIKKIFLARPAVDTEEDLGALPGDIRAKLSPFMQPLYDELQNALGCDLKKINDMMDTVII